MGQDLSRRRRETAWVGVMIGVTLYYWWERKKKNVLIENQKYLEKQLNSELLSNLSLITTLTDENRYLKSQRVLCVTNISQTTTDNKRLSLMIERLESTILEVKAKISILNATIKQRSKDLQDVRFMMSHIEQKFNVCEKELTQKFIQNKNLKPHSKQITIPYHSKTQSDQSLSFHLQCNNEKNLEKSVEETEEVDVEEHVYHSEGESTSEGSELLSYESSLWSKENPKELYTDAHMFEPGGACVGGIWLSKDSITSSQVVIKKIIADKDETPKYVHSIAKFEASVIKHLQSHPNIIKYYKAFVIEYGKEYWITMEYMNKNTLFDIVTNHKYLVTVFPEEIQISKICLEMLKGLDFMHSRHILHKDIKSENVLFNEKGEIKLADFGNSCRIDKNGKAPEQDAVGTCYWMAPEIIEEKEHDEKADVWSFGIVLYEILTGIPPFNDCKDGKEVKKTDYNATHSTSLELKQHQQ